MTTREGPTVAERLQELLGAESDEVAALLRRKADRRGRLAEIVRQDERDNEAFYRELDQQ